MLQWNIDTVRAGVIAHDVDLMGPAYEAIDARVGSFLRGKNPFPTGTHANFGYRTFLGNLRLESGLSVRQVFGGAHRRVWEEYGEARVEAGDELAGDTTKCILDALLATAGEDGQGQDAFNASLPDAPLNIAAEVQLIYEPYLTKGRKLSHLPYKIFRCENASELARDAGGKRHAGRERLRRAEAACGAIVEVELAGDKSMEKGV